MGLAPRLESHFQTRASELPAGLGGALPARGWGFLGSRRGRTACCRQLGSQGGICWARVELSGASLSLDSHGWARGLQELVGTEMQEGASASVWVRGGQVGESRRPVASPTALSPGDAVPESHGPTARGPTQSPEGLHGGNRAPSQGHTATWLRRSLRDKAKAWPETQSCCCTAQPSRSAQPWGLLKVLAAFCRRQDGVPAACRALGQAAPRASASTFFFGRCQMHPWGQKHLLQWDTVGKEVMGAHRG